MKISYNNALNRLGLISILENIKDLIYIINLLGLVVLLGYLFIIIFCLASGIFGLCIVLCLKPLS